MWAATILADIRLYGGGGIPVKNSITRYCAVQTLGIYWTRILNSLHYVQDATCEDHVIGNQVCGPGLDIVPPWQPTGEVFQFRSHRRCYGWIAAELNYATWLSPRISCDEAVLSSDPQMLGGITALVSSCYKSIGAACMGLERLFRHHCSIDGPQGPGLDPPVAQKTLKCAGGPPLDLPPGTCGMNNYCEGEGSDWGGQPFVSLAHSPRGALVNPAATKWHEACRQPA